MAHTIDSDKIYIKDVFEKWFRIPKYQRPYVWEKDHVHDLLDDISHAQKQNNKSEYFLGSIVLQKRKIDGPQEYFEYDLLDGQQRLTTLLLLTAVIRDITENKKLIEKCQSSIYQSEDPWDNIPERLRIVFDIRDDVSRFVEDHVRDFEGTKKTDKLKKIASDSKITSIKNMANAILVIRDFFETEDINIDEFYQFFRSKVLMIYVSSEELEDAFRLFTIMNDRGVKLRNSDILKAQNLRALENNKTLEEKYAKEWEDSEDYFGEDFDVFLSHIRTILVKEKARLNLLDEFEKNIYNPKSFDIEKKEYFDRPSLLNEGEDTFRLIKKYKDIYCELFDNSHFNLNIDFKIDNLLTIMKVTLPAEFWIPSLLVYYNKFGEKGLLNFLEKLDNKFSADWILQFTPTQRIENMNNLLKDIEKTDNYEEVIASKEFKIDLQNLILIINGDVYQRRYARYILYKLEYLFHSHTTKLSIPKTVSVEHILPQNPHQNSQWCKDFTDDERLELTNKIGNLVLISRRKNSSLGRSDYVDKKKKYFHKNIDLFSNSLRVLTNNSLWNKPILLNNQKEVLDHLESHYSQ